eukprot:Ihof_evm6s72 gene=Ihof_evmTU6s72
MSFSEFSSRPRSDRVCSYYNSADGCRKGSSCPFSHYGDQQQPSRRSFASHREPETSTHRRRSYTDDSRVICTFWADRGNCKRGDACAFRHIGASRGTRYVERERERERDRDRESDNVRERERNPSYSARDDKGLGVCTFWLERGVCKKGEECDFEHVGSSGYRGSASSHRIVPMIDYELRRRERERYRGREYERERIGRDYERGRLEREYERQRESMLYEMSTRAPGTLSYDYRGPVSYTRAHLVPHTFIRPMPTARASSMRAKLCSYYNLGTCKKGPLCEYLHADVIREDEALPERRMCSFFRDGLCKKGNMCDHAHVIRENEREEVERRIEEMHFSRQRTPCPFYWNTTCKKGGTCDNIHILSKERAPSNVRVCQFFESSHTCKKGNECDFLHIVD